jgi:DNA-binding Xre family transcriptional regulator
MFSQPGGLWAGREPTDEELAEEIGISGAKVSQLKALR